MSSSVNKLKSKVRESRKAEESKFSRSLQNKIRYDNDIYNNIEFWENNDINEDGKFIEKKAYDWGEASERFQKYKNQSQSKGGKRKSRKQRNKSRKQKR